MGVYIPNMEKPKHCTECYFVCRDQCELQDNSYDYDTFKEQKKHCPLIDIVRCGECKKHGKNSCPMTFTYAVITDDNNYCTYAERRATNDSNT